MLLYYVNSKSREQLVPYIILNSSPGSVIISDKTSAYINIRQNLSILDRIGYNHMWVNHSEEWVHSMLPEIHTQNIENRWRRFKMSINHKKRHLEKDILDSYVNSFILRVDLDEEGFFFALVEIINQLIGPA